MPLLLPYRFRLSFLLLIFQFIPFFFCPDFVCWCSGSYGESVLIRLFSCLLAFFFCLLVLVLLLLQSALYRERMAFSIDVCCLSIYIYTRCERPSVCVARRFFYLARAKINFSLLLTASLFGFELLMISPSHRPTHTNSLQSQDANRFCRVYEGVYDRSVQFVSSSAVCFFSLHCLVPLLCASIWRASVFALFRFFFFLSPLRVVLCLLYGFFIFIILPPFPYYTTPIDLVLVSVCVCVWMCISTFGNGDYEFLVVVLLVYALYAQLQLSENEKKNVN